MNISVTHSKSQTDQRRSILINRLSILLLALTSVYFLLDWLLEIHAQPFIYVSFFAFSLAMFFLNRMGKTGLAKAVGLTAFNAMIFVVSGSEPHNTGIHLYFFAAGAVALTVYDFPEWPKSLFFASLSMALMILIGIGDFSVIEQRHFTPENAQIFFVINATVNGAVCMYSFLLFSWLNYSAEQNLVKNEEMMQEQNHRLVKANKELDRFVYSVSHDLRAPLSSISGLINLIEKSNDMTETNQYLGLMKGRIAKLEQFIRDIIDFSRNARAETRLEDVDMRQLIRETFESLKFISGAEEILLKDDIHVDGSIRIDKTRLQIVLFNLISNAIRYRNTSPRQSFIRVSSSLKGEKLVLQIEDNGIGIGPVHQPKVFDMFYRATESSKGSGLGLYIVKETIEKLEGSIHLQSTLGEGTSFTLQLPIQRN